MRRERSGIFIASSHEGDADHRIADPFVDDTCVFAGRVREAKRARKQELDLLLAGKSARFGETLRMSQAEHSGEELRKLRRERDQLAGEGEDDWVRMVIYEDWSHGYLQMATLMPEARAVISDIAEWMDEAFGAPEPAPPSAGPSHGRRGSPRRADGHRAYELSPLISETEVTETEGESGSPIVFMPRRLRTPRESYSDARKKGHRRSRSRHSGSDDIALKCSPRSEETLLDEGALTRDDAVKETPGVSTLSEAVMFGSGTPTAAGPGTAGAGAGGKPGNTLTESELMKRRRLLDAHLLQ